MIIFFALHDIEDIPSETHLALTSYVLVDLHEHSAFNLFLFSLLFLPFFSLLLKANFKRERLCFVTKHTQQTKPGSSQEKVVDSIAKQSTSSFSLRIRLLT